MKVILENFRCYNHKTFEIPDQGLVLLSGKNGKGKTTFIQSIIYALFGKCSVKPYSHGSSNGKGCTVTLEYKDIKVIRNYKPNPHKLVVEYNDQNYTDDTAQNVINKYIGLNYDEFMVTSYVAQRSKSSVISMTPIEQLHFIEKLAFTDEIRHEYQKKFKNKVKECQSQISYIEGKISSLLEHYQKEKERMPDMSLYPDINNIPPVEELKLKEKKLKKVSLENDRSFKKVQEDLHNNKKEEERKSSILDQKKYLEIELEQFNSKKQNIGNVLSSDDIDNLNKKLVDLIENVENIKKYSLYIQCLDRANKLKDEKILDIKDNLSKIKNFSPTLLDKLYMERDELLEKQKLYEEERSIIEKENFFKDQASDIFKATISDIKNTFATFKTDKTHVIMNSLNKKYTAISKNIPKLEIEIQNLTEKNTHRKICGDIYDCPSCNTKLYFKDDILNIAGKESLSPQEDLETIIHEKKIECEKQKELKTKIGDWLGTLKKFTELNSKKPLEYTVLYDNDRFLEIRDKISKIQNINDEVAILEKELNFFQTTGARTLFLLRVYF